VERLWDIDDQGPRFPGIEESDVQRMYKELTAPVVSSSSSEDSSGNGESGSVTSGGMGYSTEQLQFENWKSVNRLLFEAESFEREREERKVQAMEVASKHTILRNKNVKADGKLQEKLAWTEEFWKKYGGKEKARSMAQEIERQRKAGVEGWRGKELNFRGVIGGR
jgi:hypothetical protein